MSSLYFYNAILSEHAMLGIGISERPAVIEPDPQVAIWMVCAFSSCIASLVPVATLFL
jgi:hypothetical protein